MCLATSTKLCTVDWVETVKFVFSYRWFSHIHDKWKRQLWSLKILRISLAGFSRSNKLVRHMRIHTGQRPYKCTYCERAFTQSNDLTLHIRRHTGDKPYVCGVCGDRFIQVLSFYLRTSLRNRCCITCLCWFLLVCVLLFAFRFGVERCDDNVVLFWLLCGVCCLAFERLLTMSVLCRAQRCRLIEGCTVTMRKVLSLPSSRRTQSIVLIGHKV